MKCLILASLLCISGCNIFKAKDVVNDTEQLAKDAEKLEQDAAPDMAIVITDAKKLVQDIKS